jgi:hypothetical protein
MRLDFLPAAVLLAGVLGACGGSTFSMEQDGGGGGADARSDAGAETDGGAMSDAADAGTPCPSSAPATGSACRDDGLECEYGSRPVPECNTIATCARGAWTVESPSGVDCPAKRDTACPKSLAEASAMVDQCQPLDLICDYAEGRCACTPGGGPIPLDAAAAARWHCQSPASPACPRPRPILGSACAGPSQTCDYGACTVPGGSAQKCQLGIWQPDAFACAL